MPLIHRGLAAAALVSGVALSAVFPQELPPTVSVGETGSATTAVPLDLGVAAPDLPTIDPAGAVTAAQRFSATSGSRVDRVAVTLPDAPWSRTQVDRLLTAYAGGAHDVELSLRPVPATDWRLVGEQLVATGLASADVRLVAGSPADRGALREAATALRSVPGQQFRLLFGAVAGERSEAGYPGDEYVDAVAVSAVAGPTALDGDHGLLWWSRFAADHAKPFGVSRWSAASNDDPAAVDALVDWLIDPAHRVTFAAFAPESDASRSAARYRERAAALAPLL